MVGRRGISVVLLLALSDFSVYSNVLIIMYVCNIKTKYSRKRIRHFHAVCDNLAISVTTQCKCDFFCHHICFLPPHICFKQSLSLNV